MVSTDYPKLFYSYDLYSQSIGFSKSKTFSGTITSQYLFVKRSESQPEISICLLTCAYRPNERSVFYWHNKVLSQAYIEDCDNTNGGKYHPFGGSLCNGCLGIHLMNKVIDQVMEQVFEFTKDSA